MCSYKGFHFLKLTNQISFFYFSLIIFCRIFLSLIIKHRFWIILRLNLFSWYDIIYFKIVDFLFSLFFIYDFIFILKCLILICARFLRFFLFIFFIALVFFFRFFTITLCIKCLLFLLRSWLIRNSLLFFKILCFNRI